MQIITVLLLIVITTTGGVEIRLQNERIVGGQETTVHKYPYMAGLLGSGDFIWYGHTCGATIINSRSILTAAHCFGIAIAAQFRLRVGSTYANSGGTVYQVVEIIPHPQYNPHNVDNDIGIFKVGVNIQFGPTVAVGSFANYDIADNEPVYALGWGAIYFQGPGSEIMREVQIWTVNHQTCVARYAEVYREVTANHLCAGWLDVGGRGQCIGDSGGPVLHHNVVVGITSTGPEQCAHPRFPPINTRVSHYINWIISHAS